MLEVFLTFLSVVFPIFLYIHSFLKKLTALETETKPSEPVLKPVLKSTPKPLPTPLPTPRAIERLPKMLSIEGSPRMLGIEGSPRMTKEYPKIQIVQGHSGELTRGEPRKMMGKLTKEPSPFTYQSMTPTSSRDSLSDKYTNLLTTHMTLLQTYRDVLDDREMTRKEFRDYQLTKDEQTMGLTRALASAMFQLESIDSKKTTTSMQTEYVRVISRTPMPSPRKTAIATSSLTIRDPRPTGSLLSPDFLKKFGFSVDCFKTFDGESTNALLRLEPAELINLWKNDCENYIGFIGAMKEKLHVENQKSHKSNVDMILMQMAARQRQNEIENQFAQTLNECGTNFAGKLLKEAEKAKKLEKKSEKKDNAQQSQAEPSQPRYRKTTAVAGRNSSSEEDFVYVNVPLNSDATNLRVGVPKDSLKTKKPKDTKKQ